jgi:hypothetical protein
MTASRVGRLGREGAAPAQPATSAAGPDAAKSTQAAAIRRFITSLLPSEDVL